MSITSLRSQSFGGQLVIDLDTLAGNYLTLQSLARPAEVAAVVKADAYGLGAEAVADVLAAVGCVHFFAAELSEALVVRRCAPEAEVYVLNGLWPGAEAAAEDAGITPVLNSREQLMRWRALAERLEQRLPAIIQLDSGMSRLGLTPEDVDWLAAQPDVFEILDVRYLMTHFADADRPNSAANADQRSRFTALIGKLPPRPTSMANSAATLADPRARGDLVRVGLALFGGAPLLDQPHAFRPVVTMTARVVQMRDIPEGAGVGYGLTYRAPAPKRLATIAVGYADGWPRSLGNLGAVFAAGARLPIVGRVSMDSMMVDATGLPPDALRPGDAVELIGPHQSIEDIAAQARTISYEILTNLSRRFERRYRREERGT